VRVRFDDVFSINAAGSVCAKVPVVLGGVRIEPGMEFGRRVRVGTVHFAGVAGRDLEVEQQAGVLYVMRPYVPVPRRDGIPRMVSALTAEYLPLEAAP